MKPATLAALGAWMRDPMKRSQALFTFFAALGTEPVPVVFESSFLTLVEQAESLAGLIAQNAELAGLIDERGNAIVEADEPIPETLPSREARS